MIAGAVQQYLKAQGLAPVSVGGFGDYSRAGPAAWAVNAESGADATHQGDADLYPVRLQIRTRAADVIRAENAGREAYALVLALNGQTITWTDPTAEASRTYQLSGIRAVQRPTWFATPEPGEETSCNFILSAREL
jgi:hypothetical protein